MDDLREKCERLAERLKREDPLWFFAVNASYPSGAFFGPRTCFDVPAHDAPLHEHLSCVGRIAGLLPRPENVEPLTFVRRVIDVAEERGITPSEAAIEVALAVLEETP